MKLKEYAALMNYGDEIVCYDSVIDSEFYLYNKHDSESDSDFPKYNECMGFLIDNLEISRIYSNGGIEVGLYTFLEQKPIVEYAKENMFEKYKYKDDDDVVEMLFDDMIFNITYGHESLSEHFLKAFETLEEQIPNKEYSSLNKRLKEAQNNTIETEPKTKQNPKEQERE